MPDIAVILIIAAVVVVGVLIVRRKTSLSSGLDALGKDMQIDRLFKNTEPMAALSIASQEIALVYTKSVKRMPLSNIVSWKHTWKDNGTKTTFHKIELTIRDLNNPRLEVLCLNRTVAEELGAALEVLMH